MMFEKNFGSSNLSWGVAFSSVFDSSSSSIYYENAKFELESKLNVLAPLCNSFGVEWSSGISSSSSFGIY